MDDNLVEPSKEFLQAMEDDLSQRLIKKAQVLFRDDIQEMKSNLKWDDANERIRQVYYMGAREELLNEMVAEQQQFKNFEDQAAATSNVLNSSEMSNAEARNEVKIGHNSPDLFKFTDRQGQEIFSIHRNVAGDVDVTLNADTTYTEAAKKFLQITFESAAKLHWINFSRALEFLKRGYQVRTMNAPVITLKIDKKKTTGQPRIYIEGGSVYDLHTYILRDDWEVVK